MSLHIGDVKYAISWLMVLHISLYIDIVYNIGLQFCFKFQMEAY